MNKFKIKELNKDQIFNKRNMISHFQVPMFYKNKL